MPPLQPVGPFITELLRRIRDPLGTAHTRAFCLTILGEAQRAVNAATGAIQGEADFTLDETNAIVDVAGLLPTACTRLVTVRDGLRDLVRAPDWRSIAEADRQWLHRTGGRIAVWAPLGTMKALVYPAPEAPVTLTAVYVECTALFADETTGISLPPPLVPAMLNLAEQWLLARQRLFPTVQTAQERFAVQAEATSR